MREANRRLLVRQNVPDQPGLPALTHYHGDHFLKTEYMAFSKDILGPAP